MVKRPPSKQGITPEKSTFRPPFCILLPPYSHPTLRRSQYMASALLDQAIDGPWTVQTARKLLAERAEDPVMYSPQDIRRRARTKIVATVGPASSDMAKLAELLQAGVDTF